MQSQLAYGHVNYSGDLPAPYGPINPTVKQKAAKYFACSVLFSVSPPMIVSMPLKITMYPPICR